MVGSDASRASPSRIRTESNCKHTACNSCSKSAWLRNSLSPRRASRGTRYCFPLTSMPWPTKAKRQASALSSTDLTNSEILVQASARPRFVSSSTSHPSCCSFPSSFAPSWIALARSGIFSQSYFFTAIIRARRRPEPAFRSFPRTSRDRTCLVQRSAPMRTFCTARQREPSSRHLHPSLGICLKTLLPCFSRHLFRSAHFMWKAFSRVFAVCLILT